ncbi:MAG: HDOD domain-containing protein [Syntrophobacteraceae bacterium]
MGTLALEEREILQQISRIKDLPALPGALERLVEIISNDQISYQEMEDVILYDQSLTARILRIANSSFYGGRGKIQSISKASLILGFDQVKAICLCWLLMQMCMGSYTISPVLREQLWKHSFATARIAGHMAENRPWINREKAYILGLLHDCGRVVMATYLGDHFEAISSLAESRKVPIWDAELQYGISHAMLGRWIAVKWGMPEDIQQVMEFHHTPGKSLSFKSEVRLIYLANILANSKEYPEYLNDPVTVSCCRDLFIHEDEWESYCDDLERIWAEVDQFWILLR